MANSVTVKVAKRRSGNGIADRLEPVVVEAADVVKEREQRIAFQKSLFRLTFDLLAIDNQADIGVKSQEDADALLSRAMENNYDDGFDGFYTAHQLLVPPVDPVAAAHMTQSLSVFRPLIDAAVVNTVGYGYRVINTVDLENEDSVQSLKDSLTVPIMKSLEEEGWHLIDGLIKAKERFSSVWTDDARSFVKAAVDSMSLVATIRKDKRSEDVNLAKAAWSRHFDQWVDRNIDEFYKIREREFGASVKRLKRQQNAERHALEMFLLNCHDKETFEEIRARGEEDIETVGGEAIEVIRDRTTREMKKLEQIPVVNVRMTRLLDPIRSWVPKIRSRVKKEWTETLIRYRKYAQTSTSRGSFVWFKEYGDPRIMDSRTGAFVGTYEWTGSKWIKTYEGYADEAAFRADNPDFREANELLYRGLYNPIGGPYPVPYWMGGQIVAQGLIANEEVQATNFDNNMVPPYWILVSGRLRDDSRKRIETFVDTVKRGRENYRRPIVLEAVSADNRGLIGVNGTPTIELKPMHETVQADATHTKYDTMGRDKLRGMRRLPPALTGQESQYTRQSIRSSMELAESQNFLPRRRATDRWWNRNLTDAFLFSLVEIQSNSPPPTDALEAATVIEKLLKSGGAGPNDARPLVETILGRSLPRFKDKRLDEVPFPLVLIEAKSQADGAKQSDTSAENPEDGMGARPEQQGMASANVGRIMKSVALAPAYVTVAHDAETAAPWIENMAEEHGGVLVLKNVNGERTMVAVLQTPWGRVEVPVSREKWAR